ncbi:MAG: hypothetical protein M3Y50_16700 [Acidobacteriota bacterium]|nr:hypothetical protein [Acidobacteriota bacterium]
MQKRALGVQSARFRGLKHAQNGTNFTHTLQERLQKPSFATSSDLQINPSTAKEFETEERNNPNPLQALSLLVSMK